MIFRGFKTKDYDEDNYFYNSGDFSYLKDNDFLPLSSRMDHDRKFTD